MVAVLVRRFGLAAYFLEEWSLMRVKDLPIDDRPRERLLTLGVEALADRELLAILLGAGMRDLDAVELAARLISRFGGLYELSRADPHDLLIVPGMGPAKVARVAAAFRLASRAAAIRGRRRITGSSDLAETVAPLLRGLRRERVIVVVCDTANNVRRMVQLTDGGTDRSLIPVRDVLAVVFAAGGTAFGVAHNHPSGGLEPSEPDIRATARLRDAAETVGLRFLDHLILTDTTWRRITTPH